MKIRYMSDIHFEFHPDGGRKFIQMLDPSGMDVLVLAGDIASGSLIPPTLELVCRRVAPVPVLYVAGNHEFYGSSFDEVQKYARKTTAKCANLHWMDRTNITINGQRFVGAPLWYRMTLDAWDSSNSWSDFRHIHDLREWVEREGQADIRFFRDLLRPGDVAISHFLPSRSCIHPKWMFAPSTYFVTDVHALIEDRKPALWIHGHTHESMDVSVGATRIVCNPFGYEGHETNPSFNRDALIEI